MKGCGSAIIDSIPRERSHAHLYSTGKTRFNGAIYYKSQDICVTLIRECELIVVVGLSFPHSIRARIPSLSRTTITTMLDV